MKTNKNNVNISDRIMENTRSEELKKLKLVIDKKRSGIKSIKDLIKHEIDRDFFELHTDEHQSENINSMNKTLNVMRNLSDPRPFSGGISSHRKFSGFFIVLAKKITLKIMKLYTNLLMDRQKRYNENDIDYKAYNLENQKQIDNRLGKIEEKLIEIEDSFDNLEDKLNLLINKSKKDN